VICQITQFSTGYRIKTEITKVVVLKILKKSLFRGAAVLILAWTPFAASANPESWREEWTITDFTKTSVDFSEIMSGGPPKDGIPPIDNPIFKPIAEIDDLPDTEPVIGITIEGKSKAYPLRVLMWHEIVNDELGGVPIAVTFCPLCNAAIVFDRRVNDEVLDFGTTGKLRNSDLVMYDRQTESWWQQFTGTAIVGDMLGTELKVLTARLESFRKFKQRTSDGQVLVPNHERLRRYGANPYVGYDSAGAPFLYRGEYPENISPLDRVVTVDGTAYWLHLVKTRGRMEIEGGIVITWEPGQNSALDTPIIAEGLDVGNVTVQRKDANGNWQDIPYGVDFAFAFYAFHPDRPIIVK
jgi:hypothetical protein